MLLIFGWEKHGIDNIPTTNGEINVQMQTIHWIWTKLYMKSNRFSVKRIFRDENQWDWQILSNYIKNKFITWNCIYFMYFQFHINKYLCKWITLSINGILFLCIRRYFFFSFPFAFDLIQFNKSQLFSTFFFVTELPKDIYFTHFFLLQLCLYNTFVLNIFIYLYVYP